MSEEHEAAAAAPVAGKDPNAESAAQPVASTLSEPQQPQDQRQKKEQLEHEQGPCSGGGVPQQGVASSQQQQKQPRHLRQLSNSSSVPSTLPPQQADRHATFVQQQQAPLQQTNQQISFRSRATSVASVESSPCAAPVGQNDGATAIQQHQQKQVSPTALQDPSAVFLHQHPASQMVKPAVEVPTVKIIPCAHGGPIVAKRKGRFSVLTPDASGASIVVTKPGSGMGVGAGAAAGAAAGHPPPQQSVALGNGSPRPSECNVVPMENSAVAVGPAAPAGQALPPRVPSHQQQQAQAQQQTGPIAVPPISRLRDPSAPIGGGSQPPTAMTAMATPVGVAAAPTGPSAVPTSSTAPAAAPSSALQQPTLTPGGGSGVPQLQHLPPGTKKKGRFTLLSAGEAPITSASGGRPPRATNGATPASSSVAAGVGAIDGAMPICVSQQTVKPQQPQQQQQPPQQQNPVLQQTVHSSLPPHQQQQVQQHQSQQVMAHQQPIQILQSQQQPQPQQHQQQQQQPVVQLQQQIQHSHQPQQQTVMLQQPSPMQPPSHLVQAQAQTQAQGHPQTHVSQHQAALVQQQPQQAAPVHGAPQQILVAGSKQPIQPGAVTPPNSAPTTGAGVGNHPLPPAVAMPRKAPVPSVVDAAGGTAPTAAPPAASAASAPIAHHTASLSSLDSKGGATAAGAPGLGKVLYFLDQMRLEVVEADRTIKCLQKDIKFLKEKNKELESRKNDFERRFNEEKSLREASEGKVRVLKKKVKELKEVVPVANDVAFAVSTDGNSAPGAQKREEVDGGGHLRNGAAPPTPVESAPYSPAATTYCGTMSNGPKNMAEGPQASSKGRMLPKTACKAPASLQSEPKSMPGREQPTAHVTGQPFEMQKPEMPSPVQRRNVSSEAANETQRSSSGQEDGFRKTAPAPMTRDSVKYSKRLQPQPQPQPHQFRQNEEYKAGRVHLAANAIGSAVSLQTQFDPIASASALSSAGQKMTTGRHGPNTTKFDPLSSASTETLQTGTQDGNTASSFAGPIVGGGSNNSKTTSAGNSGAFFAVDTGSFHQLPLNGGQTFGRNLQQPMNTRIPSHPQQQTQTCTHARRDSNADPFEELASRRAMASQMANNCN